MRETLLRTLLLAGAGFTALPAGMAAAEPVDYVKVCDMFGANFFFIPGTEICYNTQNGETRQQTAEGVYRTLNRLDYAFEGQAVAAAMPTAVLDAGKMFAVAVSGGFYDDGAAAAIAGAVSINDNLSLDGGLSIGASQTTVGSNIGFNFTW